MNNIINELNKTIEHDNLIIKDLLKENTELSEKNIELENRIDKVIDYIEKGSYKDLYNIKSIDKLLETLKGDSNE